MPHIAPRHKRDLGSRLISLSAGKPQPPRHSTTLPGRACKQGVTGSSPVSGFFQFGFVEPLRLAPSPTAEHRRPRVETKCKHAHGRDARPADDSSLRSRSIATALGVVGGDDHDLLIRNAGCAQRRDLGDDDVGLDARLLTATVMLDWAVAQACSERGAPRRACLLGAQPALVELLGDVAGYPGISSFPRGSGSRNTCPSRAAADRRRSRSRGWRCCTQRRRRRSW